MTVSRSALLQRIALWTTLAGALAVRLWYVLHTVMPVVDSDAFNYDGSAVRLLTKGYFAYASGSIEALKSNAFTMPGFTLFLAGIYRVFGMGADRYIAVYIAQAVVSTLTVALVYLIGRRVTDSAWAGLAAAVIAAVYPPFIYGNGIIATEALYTFALTAAVWLVLLADERGAWSWFLVAGIAFGLTTLIRATAVPWMLAVVAYLIVKKYGWRRLAVSSAAMALGFVIVLSPWWVRNYVVLHRVVVFNSITANPLFRSTYLYQGRPPRFAVEWPYRFGQDEFALNDYQGRIAAERAWSALRQKPWGFVVQRLNRTRAALVTGWAIPRLGAVARFTAALQITLLWLFLVSPLLYVRRAEVWLVWTLPVLFAVVHTILLVFPRYVFPVMPLVIALAVAALWAAVVWVARLAAGRRVSQVAGPAH